VTTSIRSRLGRYRRFAPLAATITLFCLAYAFGAVVYDGMRDPQVFLNMFRAAPFLLISAIGMTFVILSGGIDLSVGGVVALTTVVSAALLRNNGMDPWLVMLIVLVMGNLRRHDGFFITYQGAAVHRHTGRLRVARPVLLHQRQRDSDPQSVLRGPRGRSCSSPA
jgi:ribose/xylose/arabinose/galactoside ABC-type transport system permease subunit